MTSSSLTFSLNKMWVQMPRLRIGVDSVVKSFSQLFFSDKNYVGYCFIIFVGYLSIAAVLHALLAVIIGNATAWLFFKKDRHIVSIGGIGYQCAIIGFYLTAFIYFHPVLGLLTLFGMSMLTVFLNHGIRWCLHPFGMPILTLPAVLVIMMTYYLYVHLWHLDIRSPFNVIFHPHYLVLFYIGYLTLFFLVHYRAAILICLMTLPVMISSIWLQTNMIYLVINMAIAIFGPIAYFIPRHSVKWRAGFFAGVLSFMLYWLGQVLYWRWGMPDLLLPAIFATWIVFAVLFGVRYQLPVFPNLDQVCKILQSAWSSQQKIVVLTGAGTSTPSGIPDYASGKWIDPDVPVHYYTFPVFLKSRAARQCYFDSAYQFLLLAQSAKPTMVHNTLAHWQKKNLLRGIITQNVDGLLQKAGCHSVIELHGNIRGINCVRCGAKTTWPNHSIWKEQDLYCEHCQGLLKPAVKAYEEPLSMVTWENALTVLSSAQIVLILGSRLLVQSVVHLVAFARQQGAKIILINDSDVSHRLYAGDLFVLGKLEKILPVLSKL